MMILYAMNVQVWKHRIYMLLITWFLSSVGKSCDVMGFFPTDMLIGTCERTCGNYREYFLSYVKMGGGTMEGLSG